VPARFDVAKVLVGAFALPWWHRRAFARALAVPLVLLVAFTLGWHYAARRVPVLWNWAFCAGWAVLFAWFAVTCHRLVLLDAASVALRLVPRWTWRETRFVFWGVGMGLVFMVVLMLSSLLLGASMNAVSAVRQDSSGFDFQWIPVLAQIPAYYALGRLAPVFPAIAVDRTVDFGWAWRLTQGNGWRLFIVVAILPWAMSELVALLYRGGATAVETLLLTALGTTLFAVEIAALSLSYRELIRDEAPPDATPAR
jgi:hypothetical protein